MVVLDSCTRRVNLRSDVISWLGNVDVFLLFSACAYQKLHPACKSLKLAVSAVNLDGHESCRLLVSFNAVVLLPDSSKYANRDLAVLQRLTRKRASLRTADRLLWVILSRVWAQWRSALVVVKPETVIAWQRKAFRSYWRWESRAGKSGRPCVSRELRELIKKMSTANPLWGAPRIHGELLELGIQLSQATVAKYMVRQRKPPSQTWRTFLENYVKELVSTDFLVVSTVSFRLLFVFVVLGHHRRRVIHFNVTAHPTAEWTARQIAEAFPWDSAPRYLVHDRDCIYGASFRERVGKWASPKC